MIVMMGNETVNRRTECNQAKTNVLYSFCPLIFIQIHAWLLLYFHLYINYIKVAYAAGAVLGSEGKMNGLE